MKYGLSREHVIHAHPPTGYRWLGVRDVAATEERGQLRIGCEVQPNRLSLRIDIPNRQRAREEIVDPLGRDCILGRVRRKGR